MLHPNPSPHFCAVQANIGPEACCQLIRLLNMPERVPFCHEKTHEVIVVPKNSTASDDMDSAGNKSATAISTLFQRSYPKFGPPTPVMNLKVPPDEVPEEHLTFLFGVFMLISMAVICTLFLMKLAKAGSADDARLQANRCIGGILPSDYSLMLWLPGGTSRHGHRSASAHRVRRHPSLFVLLRSSFRCAGRADSTVSGETETENGTISSAPFSGRKPANSRTVGSRRPPIRGRSCVSIVSSSSMNALLPNLTPSTSSGSAGLAAILNSNTSRTMSNSASGGALAEMPPPPCYEELQEFSTSIGEKK